MDIITRDPLDIFAAILLAAFGALSLISVATLLWVALL